MLDDKPIIPAGLPGGFGDHADGEKGVPFPVDHYLALVPASRRELLTSVVTGPILWVGYGRYSTDHQDPDSLDRQHTNVSSLWSGPGNALLEWCTDAGVSGTTMNRPGLTRMLAHVREGRCKAVGVEDVDRLSRNVGHLLLIFEELQQRGVDLYDHAHGKLSWMQVYLFGLMAQLGRERMLKLMTDGRDEKIRKGRIFSAPVFAYANDKQNAKLRVVDEDLRPLVVWIFEAIANGATCYQVAKDLCRKHPFPRASARKGKWGRPRPFFTEKMVRRIIENPLYMGVNVWKRSKQMRDFLTGKITGTRLTDVFNQILVEVKHLAIVSQNLWARANAALADRNPGVSGDGKRSGPFSGRLVCACAGPLRRVGPPDRLDLRCEGRERPAPFKCEAIPALPLAWVEEVLLDRIFKEIDGSGHNARFRDHVAKIIAKDKAEEYIFRRKMQNELAAVDRKLHRFMDEDAVIGNPPEWLCAARKALRERQSSLTNSLAACSRQTERDRILADFTRLDNAVDVIRARLPFKVECAEDQELIDAVGDIVRAVKVSPTADAAVFRFDMRLRCGERVKVASNGCEPQLSLALGDLYDDSQDFIISFEASQEEARAERRSPVKGKRAAAREAIAESGVHDVSAKAWKVIRPLIADADFGSGERKLDPRRAFDGIFFFLKTRGANIEQLPARYCEGNAIFLLARRLKRAGTLDRIFEALKREMPAVLAGCKLELFDNSRYPRGKSAIDGARSARQLTARDAIRLEAAAEAETDDQAALRMRAVAMRIDGATCQTVADRYGFSSTYVVELQGRFCTGDIEALRSRPHRGPPSVFTQELVGDLKKFIGDGFDPKRPGQPLTRADVQAFLKGKGIQIGIEHLARKLRENGVVISECIAATRLAQAA